ncbi:hypothetical protein [Candidatus Palauibacter sp.]|uniref:hypothetical protein n=1 Tax=Candidatus Palauibacter sp. TaxID=3101350 RepID=UPI003B5CDB72
MSEPGQSSALQFLGEPQSGRADEQQLAARELVDAVGQLLKEAILHDESTESWWGDRLRAFSEALMGLRDARVLTDDQALELLSLLLAQIGESEVSKITSDLLDAALGNVGRHVNAGLEFAPDRKPTTRLDVRAAFVGSG